MAWTELSDTSAACGTAAKPAGANRLRSPTTRARGPGPVAAARHRESCPPNSRNAGVRQRALRRRLDPQGRAELTGRPSFQQWIREPPQCRVASGLTAFQSHGSSMLPEAVRAGHSLSVHWRCDVLIRSATRERSRPEVALMCRPRRYGGVSEHARGDIDGEGQDRGVEAEGDQRLEHDQSSHRRCRDAHVCGL